MNCWTQIEAPLKHLVSSEEWARSQRYLQLADRVRHLLGCALIRAHFRQRSTVALPSRWPLNAWGKPLGEAWGRQFNISHTASRLWLVSSAGAQVGIDVEDQHPTPADLFPLLHPDEIQDLALDPSPRRCHSLWTRKEAVIKAHGMGLSLPLTSFSVASDQQPHHWLRSPPPDQPGPWLSCDLQVVAAKPSESDHADTSPFNTVAVAALGEVDSLSYRELVLN